MFSFRYTSGVCKHKKTILSYRMGQNIQLQTLVNIFTKYLWILQIYISQGSVASNAFRVWWYYKFSTECAS